MVSVQGQKLDTGTRYGLEIFYSSVGKELKLKAKNFWG